VRGNSAHRFYQPLGCVATLGPIGGFLRILPMRIC
jgi:hypothetical protein